MFSLYGNWHLFQFLNFGAVGTFTQSGAYWQELGCLCKGFRYWWVRDTATGENVFEVR